MKGTIEEIADIATLQRELQRLSNRVAELEGMLTMEHIHLQKLEHEHDHDHSVVYRLEHDPCHIPRIPVGL